MTHATPASFVAHDASRGSYEDIAKWFLKGTADVFIGGGINHFRVRSDSADLTVELKNMGYDVVYSMTDLNNSKSGRIAGLMAEDGMPTSTRGGILSFLLHYRQSHQGTVTNKKGFILMVEGSEIDWAAHDNNMKRTIEEVLDIDRAVGLHMTMQRNQETLSLLSRQTTRQEVLALQAAA